MDALLVRGRQEVMSRMLPALPNHLHSVVSAQRFGLANYDSYFLGTHRGHSVTPGDFGEFCE